MSVGTPIEPLARNPFGRYCKRQWQPIPEGDERPWHFVVVEDLATRERIAETHPAAHIVVQAPMVIVVCGDETLQKHPGFWVQDCAAASENILIKAQTMGLGAMWFGVYPVEGSIRELNEVQQQQPASR